MAMIIMAAATGCSDKNSQSSSMIDESKIFDMTAMEVAADMSVGWNLGDTLDVCAADRDGDGRVNETPAEGEKVDETLWGNVMTTPELFKNLKKDGINAVRIPVTWRDHLGEAPDYKIDEEWLTRVHEVVDYALAEDMYVIINVHHDGGGDPEFGAWIRNASQDYDTFEVKYTALWNQIAESFSDYSGRLIFESMNEVGFDGINKRDAYLLLNKINQLFVDIVRASGGNNTNRHLLIAGYWTDTVMTCSKMYQLPIDSAQNKLMVSVHYYTPWEFCTTNIQQSWGSDSEVAKMKSDINSLKSTFVDNGVPVIIGEFGTGTGNDTSSRIYFAQTLTQLCSEADIPCFYWDNGNEYDRVNMKWRTDGLIEAMSEAAA